MELSCGVYVEIGAPEGWDTEQLLIGAALQCVVGGCNVRWGINENLEKSKKSLGQI